MYKKLNGKILGKSTDDLFLLVVAAETGFNTTRLFL